jgi:hypothetical protein
MEKTPDKQEKQHMHKLHMYDVAEYMLSVDKETQIRLLKMLVMDLQLTNIREAIKPLGVTSYNGVKNFRETVTIGKTKFAVLKGNVIVDILKD